MRLGLFRESSGHEHLPGSLIVPVMNLDGDVVQLYGRKVTRMSALRSGTEAHLYLPGPMRGVWNEQALVASKEIILCEALIDALTFWCAGYRHVTTSYGVNGFTKDHRAALEGYGIQRVYIAYDNDEAGNKAAAKLAEELMPMGIECFRVEFPKGMDANEYALKVQPAAKSFGVLLHRATWLGRGSRPADRVAVPVIAPVPAAEERAAKEKNMEPEIVPAPAKIEEPAQWFEAAKQADADVLPLAASAATSAPQVEIKGDDVLVRFEGREYRVRGLGKNTSPDVLRINLRVLGMNKHGDMALHVDTLDLNAARSRMLFAKQAAEELHIKAEIIHGDLGKVLLKLEQMRDEQIARLLAPKSPLDTMTDAEREAALALLRDPRLSRHLDKPLAVIVQSSSAAGKSSLMDAVLAFVPEEQRVQYSAMTGQSLFYMGDTDLQNKVLAISEEAGAQRASYPLKLLQSEGEVSIASTGKDAVSGKHVTHTYRVKGPVMLFLTTTAVTIDEELLNRCIVLTVDEDREQTRAIHRVQREAQTLEGLLRKRKRDAVVKLHRNAQRLLRPLDVVNEHAVELSFPDAMTRTRRDHTKYLSLIRAIALLHQHQRTVKTAVDEEGKPFEYIEAMAKDVELAKQLIHEVLGHSLDDMHVQTRKLLLLVDQMVTAACAREKIERTEYRFSRRDVRAFTRWSDSQLKTHMSRLQDMEYLIVHRGGRGQSFVYELFFEATEDTARPTLSGLEHGYDAKKSGREGNRSGGSLAPVREVSGGSLGEESLVSMRVPAPFYADALEITSEGEAEENAVVAVPRLNGNGAGHHAGATRWPV